MLRNDVEIDFFFGFEDFPHSEHMYCPAFV